MMEDKVRSQPHQEIIPSTHFEGIKCNTSMQYTYFKWKSNHLWPSPKLRLKHDSQPSLCKEQTTQWKTERERKHFKSNNKSCIVLGPPEPLPALQTPPDSPVRVKYVVPTCFFLMFGFEYCYFTWAHSGVISDILLFGKSVCCHSWGRGGQTRHRGVFKDGCGVWRWREGVFWSCGGGAAAAAR